VVQSYVPDGTRRGLVDWTHNWQLDLSIQKCGGLLFHNKLGFTDTHDLLIDNITLPCLRSCLDLGVIINSNLSFSDHIESIVVKAKRRSYLIFKSFHTRDVELLTLAYNTYILPKYYNSIA